MHLPVRQQNRPRVPQRVEHDTLLGDAPDPERATVTRAAPVRIVANEFDVAAARLPALPGRAGIDYPVTACLPNSRSPAYPLRSYPWRAMGSRSGPRSAACRLAAPQLVRP